MDTKLSFRVKRKPAELITPAKPTPNDQKPLSDLDDREGLRYKLSGVQIYAKSPCMENDDPVKAMREALAKTLVFYYPFAGRLREGPDRKLTVDCSGQGVVFVAAEADVRAEEFPLYPPFPCMDQLLYDHQHGSQEIVNSPLMFIQVTRLLRGGFIFAIKFTHNICDAFGMSQFLTALGEIARGRTSPSVFPIWKRELLNVRNPPQPTCTHHEFTHLTTRVNVTTNHSPDSEMVYRSFFFNSTNISVLRNHVPPHLAKCSTFDLLAACIWRNRTIALALHPEQKVRLVFAVNARSRLKSCIPVGYYGNVFVLPGVISTVEELCNKPIGYALELVMNAKANVTEEYVRSFIDLTVMKGRAPISTEWTYIVDDLTQLGLWDTDYGWGKPVYGGMAYSEVDPVPGTGNYFLRIRKKDGNEDEIVAPMCLPACAMQRFDKELKKLLVYGNSGSQIVCIKNLSAL
ncbi:hypothetical protein DCAR_0416893 [Daucus carota subsp. sativus]|uniref:Uncharacterized protein n=1 Tax=Daucus carota subsp. sativus TaxID=79200 RepID=A0A165XVU3_DAUCS|nr:PREDICTED: benzyl alcohol O-benzoyltransferase-like [Daucus carota subsp. sativus]WOG97552.1 hypothetical protein DCAR_0416893 [Daucus carota subsp. sativus]